MLVERAWNRGLEIGRYKAVDDTLAHGVVAYAGMPGLIFTWAKRNDKRVQFELLDNSVRAGERPRTVAFGSNRTLYVLDVKCMLDVERYRRVNVDASAPGELYRDAEAAAAGAQRGLPEAVPRALPGGGLRRPGDRPHLPRDRCGSARLCRSRRARDGRSRTPRPARHSWPSCLRRSTGRCLRRTRPAISRERSAAAGLVTLGAWGSIAGDDPSSHALRMRSALCGDGMSAH